MSGRGNGGRKQDRVKNVGSSPAQPLISRLMIRNFSPYDSVITSAKWKKSYLFLWLDVQVRGGVFETIYQELAGPDDPSMPMGFLFHCTFASVLFPGF